MKHFKKAGTDALPTIADVLAYLQKAGWKVTRTSLYRHHREGKILPLSDGSYGLKDVEKYAKTWLKQQSTGKRVSVKMDELQRKKLERELEIQDIDYERKKFAHAKDLGKFIPRAGADIHSAALIGIFDAALRHWIQTQAVEFIREVGGDIKMVSSLINLMNEGLDECENSIATYPGDYEVIFEGAGETDAEKANEDETQ